MNELRDHTRDRHEQTEQLLDVQRLRETAYRVRALELFYEIQTGWHLSMADHEIANIAGLKWPARDRRPLLLNDLGGAVDHLEPATMTLPSSIEYAIGAAYVIEGSSQGGKFIARALTHHGMPLAEIKYFAGNDNDQLLWREMRAFVNAQLVTSEQVEVAIEGAHAMFDLFESRLIGLTRV